jgi:hypothetical protein
MCALRICSAILVSAGALASARAQSSAQLDDPAVERRVGGLLQTR